MYKITIFDENNPGIFSGTACFFTYNIKEFEKRWFNLLDNSLLDYKELKNKFIRSKNGEVVSDWYYEDNEELNIVQRDSGETYHKKEITLRDKTFSALNFYRYETVFHIDCLRIKFRWIKFKDKFFRIAYFIADGASCLNMFTKNYEIVRCYGNPVIENTLTFNPSCFGINGYNPSYTLKDFSKNKLETVCWLVTSTFENKDSLDSDFNTFEVTDEVLNILFKDIVGEAG